MPAHVTNSTLAVYPAVMVMDARFKTLLPWIPEVAWLLSAVILLLASRRLPYRL